MAEVVICELLCYVQHYIDKCPKENIVSSVSSFYTVSEVEAAKAVMADIVGDTEAARRRAGSGKRKLDVEDILSMYESHDKTGATAMPTFAETPPGGQSVGGRRLCAGCERHGPPVPDAESDGGHHKAG